ncbi:hypothetical protein BCR15_08475 [Tessaracoccus lapidicaptus]|uniref:Methylamine utilisation protein MauE domain-containing protein n=1 Tax=Tessaracoccus lapidicaptus TaxID=1427523 RepID=A0A1C0AHX7_9ACTN|nr:MULTISPECIES: MauE/DoxX family redox-associated membrane protein [Tessaracoccus]AQX16680.1 hypothetical protein BKM78_12745 [Tessaracoccus sp. T2.5-30]OCL31659.1 hypothetical protein BCR15_08475 [Tessaracoccus lapidicaptus]
MSYLVLGNLAVAVLLAISGAAKLRSPEETRDAFQALRLPGWLRRSPAPVLLPWGELALAVLLIVGAGWVLVIAAAAATLLMAAYAVVIARALTFDEPVRCHCFGAHGGDGVTRRTLLRNVLLLVTSVLGLVGAVAGVSIYSQPAAGWGWIAMAALAAVVAVLSLAGGGESPSGGVASVAPTLTIWEVSSGERVTLRKLAGRHGGIVLLSVVSGCSGCERVLAALPGWLAESPGRTVVPMRPAGHAVDDPKWESLALLHEDWGSNVTHTLVGSRTPSAIELDAAGVPVGEPAVGPAAVEELIRGRVEPEPAVEAPAAPVEEEPDDYVRRPIPDSVLIDADGEPLTLRQVASQQAQLLVTIDCLCSPARHAIASITDWQQRLPVLEVRLVPSIRPRDPAAVPAEVQSTALYDHGGFAARALGATGKVAAVLLGADGLIAGGPVTGLEAVEDFVADIEDQIRAAAAESDVPPSG